VMPSWEADPVWDHDMECSDKNLCAACEPHDDRPQTTPVVGAIPEEEIPF
jgi:hypothetical protein